MRWRAPSMRWRMLSTVFALAGLVACATAPVGTPAAPDDPEAGVFVPRRGDPVRIRPETLIYSGQGAYTWPDGRTYDGTFVDGRPDGAGVEVLPDGERYEGEFADGAREGFGILVLADGGRYEGQFDAGLRSGHGRFSSPEGSYSGEWAGDVPHGEGIFEYSDGSRYQGEWLVGRRQGVGRYEQRNGSWYEGEWVGDMPHGFGRVEETSGTTYDGAWERGQRAGYGRMTTRAGVTYEGTWVADEREGYGLETRPDGTRYSGEWHAGMRDGVGVAESVTGSRHEGSWEHNSPLGPGTRRSDEGTEITGTWAGNVVSAGLLRLPTGRDYAGNLYDDSNTRVDPAFLRWLTAEAERGDPHAQLLLGEAYTHFEEPAADRNSAMLWYGRAAASGVAEAAYQLAQIRLESSDPEEAIALFESAAMQGHAASNAALGAFYQLGDHGLEKSHARAKAYYEAALGKGHAVARNNLAWLLATSPDASLRDGARAVELAEPIAYLYDDWGYFDTLAAAHAERGDFARAVEVERLSIERADEAATEDDIEDLEARLALYERGEPYREP